MRTHPVNSLCIADRFEIGNLERDLLGRGGMGDVYRGRDLQTGQAVAIKALRPEVVSGDPNALARFVREGEALRQLNHPNIVQMVDALESEQRHYLVMEYVPGGSLRDLLDQRGGPGIPMPGGPPGLPIERTVEVALDVADALTRAHRLGILHRDLKPSNVLLAEDGTPRLTDFGIAHVSGARPLTQTDTVVGTIDYLSPEACNVETLDARTDIWAFGVMLYEMLSGERPFSGESPMATLMAILTQPVPDLSQACPKVPDALADLVYRMLEKDRRQRIPSVRMVGVELEAILEATCRPSSIVPRPSLPTTSRFAPPTPPTEGAKHNLPVQVTPFVGREAELAELDRLLADPEVRLVTVLGAGGMGKTRLALRAAEGQRDRFSNGVRFVSLAPLRSTDAIVPTTAEALSFSFYEGGTRRQQLLDYLRQKQMLLLLDNWEHLLDGVDVVADILKTAQHVKILATSRARLNVQDEHLYHIAGLGFPKEGVEAPPQTAETTTQYSAVQLFVQSARRVRPGYQLAADDLEHVIRICRLVQGMPLGILLAAAWIEMLTPEEVAAEMGHGLDFLETDLRDLPERQRSMRAVFHRSWNLLAERERQVLQEVSVFRGGFTRQAAQQVTGASLRELMLLVDRSLLYRAPTGRYEIHELLRQYAAEKLAQSPNAGEAAHDRHCAYYVAALQRWDSDLKGPRQQAALAEMDADIENARAAWDWAVEQGQVGRIEQALEGLSWCYEMGGRVQEGEAAFRMAAQMMEKLAQAASFDKLRTGSGDVRRVWAKILTQLSFFSYALGRTQLISQLLGQILTLLEGPELADQDTRAVRASVLHRMGGCHRSDDWEEARLLFEESLALYRALGDRWNTANVLGDLSVVAIPKGNYSGAQQFARESLALLRALGDRWEIARTVRGLGEIAWLQGQLEEAERLLREVITIHQETGLGSSAAEIPVKGLLHLGWTLLLRGKFTEAHDLFQEALARCGDSGYRHQMGFALSDLGFAKLHLGWYDRARVQAQMSLGLAREGGLLDDRPIIGRSLHVLGAVALVGEASAEAQQLLQESVAVYQGLGHRERLDQARAVLGYAARGLGDLCQARRHLSTALRTAADTGAFRPLIYALPAAALLLADRRETAQAVEVYALASRHPFVANSRWFEDVAGKHIAAVATTLPPDVVAAAQERGRARDLEATVAELLAELEGE